MKSFILGDRSTPTLSIIGADAVSITIRATPQGGVLTVHVDGVPRLHISHIVADISLDIPEPSASHPYLEEEILQ